MLFMFQFYIVFWLSIHKLPKTAQEFSGLKQAVSLWSNGAHVPRAPRWQEVELIWANGGRRTATEGVWWLRSVGKGRKDRSKLCPLETRDEGQKLGIWRKWRKIMRRRRTWLFMLFQKNTVESLYDLLSYNEQYVWKCFIIKWYNVTFWVYKLHLCFSV